MFRFFKKNPLEIPLEKLKDDQIKLSLQIRKIEEEIADIERQTTNLFEEGKKAKTRSEELSIATKIKTLSQKKQNLQATHVQLNKQMMLVSNLIIIKENESLLKSSPVYKMLKKMSPEELEEKLTTNRLDAERLNENLMTAIGYTDQAITVGYEEYEEDESIKKIMETIRSVKEGDLEPEKATKKVEKLKE